MMNEVLNRCRDVPAWALGRLKQWAPEGWNTNTQFFLVFLGILGLHLWLAQVIIHSAATAEPGDGPIEANGVVVEVSNSAGPSDENEHTADLIRATPLETPIPEFDPPPPPPPADTLVLTDSSLVAKPGEAETPEARESVDVENLSPVALVEAEQGLGPPATKAGEETIVSEDEIMGPQLSELIAGADTAGEAAEGSPPSAESSSGPPVAAPISVESGPSGQSTKTRSFRELP